MTIEITIRIIEITTPATHPTDEPSTAFPAGSFPNRPTRPPAIGETIRMSITKVMTVSKAMRLSEQLMSPVLSAILHRASGSDDLSNAVYQQAGSLDYRKFQSSSHTG